LDIDKIPSHQFLFTSYETIEMKTTAGKPTFKGTKAFKDFFTNDDTKVEAPGKFTTRAPSCNIKLAVPIALARPYTQVAKADMASNFTNTLVQAPLQVVPKGSTALALPVALPRHPHSYASVATAPPPASADDFAGWNENVKSATPGKSKTPTSPVRAVPSLPLPVASTSAKPTPRLPRLSKTTASSSKTNPLTFSTTFKFVANASSPKSPAKSYAPPSSLARPKVNATTPQTVIKNTTRTATGSFAGIKTAPSKLFSAIASTSDGLSTKLSTSSDLSAAPKAHVIAPPIAIVKNAEVSRPKVKKASTKKEVAAARPEVKLPEPAATKTNRKKNKKVAPALAPSSPSTARTKSINKKVAMKPVEEKVDTKLVNNKVDNKIVDNIAHSAAAAAHTVVPAASQDVASSEDKSTNDSVVATTTGQEQVVPSSSHTSGSSNQVLPDSIAADSQIDGSSVLKKKKRNQKSGAQRKKEGRTRALAVPSITTQIADLAPAISLVAPQNVIPAPVVPLIAAKDADAALPVPVITTKDADLALAATFVRIQIAKIEIEARLDALKYPLSRNASRLESMARSVPMIKMSRRDLEKDLRTALTTLYMQGINMNVYEKTYELSEGYKAQHGHDLTEEDKRHLEHVLNHEVKAYRNVSTNLEVHARAAKALEELQSQRVPSAFQARESMPFASEFQFVMSGAFRVLDAGATPMGEPMDFKLPPLASDFNFNMPSKSPSPGKYVSIVPKPELTDFPSLFGGPTSATVDEFKSGCQNPDTDTSESDDTTFHSEESDSSVTEDESPSDAVVQKKDEPCMALTKYHDSLLFPTDFAVPLLGEHQSSPATEDELPEEVTEEKKPCLVLAKYRGSPLDTTAVATPLLDGAHFSPTTDNAAEPATVIIARPTATMEFPQMGFAFSVVVKLAAPFQPLPAQILPVKLGFNYRLPPEALQVLNLHDSYKIPPVLKLQVPPVEDAASPPAKDVAKSGVRYAATSSNRYAAQSPTGPSKSMVLASKPRRVPRTPSTPSQRNQRGPYRLNTPIGISPFREFLMELPDPIAHTFRRADLIEAFITLSSRERVELEIGFPHSWTAVGVLNNKRLANRILLGSIRLSEYLDEICFDRFGIAMDSDVVGAWEDLAKKDEAFSALEEAWEPR
jgi:hypothetical protein